MARIEKTVFISYRRTDFSWALLVYKYLTSLEYDVFFDFSSLSSGDFEQVIVSNIKARAHFVLILTPTALDRCNKPSDWLRREIEIAIDEKRNIVPLFFDGFNFGSPSVLEKLTGKLEKLNRYNGINVPIDFFEEAMQRLSTKFLNKPLDAVLHPVSTEVQKVVKAEQVAADKALEQIEDVKELAKQADEKPVQPQLVPVPDPKEAELERLKKQAIQYELRGKFWDALQIYYQIKRLDPLFPSVDMKIRELEKETQPKSVPAPSLQTSPVRQATRNVPTLFRSIAIGIAALLVIILGFWGGISLWNNLSTATPESTPTLGVGSSIIGKDGMTLFYVPAGEFTMGSETNENEKPIHTVNLDAFWIDQTEVTNKMYALCVETGACKEPVDKSSSTHSTYYGNAQFDNYPVIYVNWYMAKTYCEWVGRRLPTEAEWEKAARGTDARTYPWGNDAPNNNLLNYNSAVGDTTVVGKYPDGKSIYGAYDMAGNVWEWVSSLYQLYPYNVTDGRESLTSSDARVLRGGSWNYDNYYVRSANRYWIDPTFTFSNFGFRCSRSP